MPLLHPWEHLAWHIGGRASSSPSPKARSNCWWHFPPAVCTESPAAMKASQQGKAQSQFHLSMFYNKVRATFSTKDYRLSRPGGQSTAASITCIVWVVGMGGFRDLPRQQFTGRRPTPGTGMLWLLGTSFSIHRGYLHQTLVTIVLTITGTGCRRIVFHLIRCHKATRPFTAGSGPCILRPAWTDFPSLLLLVHLQVFAVLLIYICKNT